MWRMNKRRRRPGLDIRGTYVEGGLPCPYFTHASCIKWHRYFIKRRKLAEYARWIRIGVSYGE